MQNIPSFRANTEKTTQNKKLDEKTAVLIANFSQRVTSIIQKTANIHDTFFHTETKELLDILGSKELLRHLDSRTPNFQLEKNKHKQDDWRYLRNESEFWCLKQEGQALLDACQLYKNEPFSCVQESGNVAIDDITYMTLNKTLDHLVESIGKIQTVIARLTNNPFSDEHKEVFVQELSDILVHIRNIKDNGKIAIRLHRKAKK